MTLDEQIETFLRHHTFPYSNRKAAKVELLRIIDRVVRTTLSLDMKHIVETEVQELVSQAVMRRESEALAAMAKASEGQGLVASFNDGSNISYSFGYGPGC